MKYIDKKDIYSINNSIIIDVRTPNEYSINHINNSINIPLSNIIGGIKKYNKDKAIILYCDHGKRSLIAYRLLNAIGYNNIYIINNM